MAPRKSLSALRIVCFALLLAFLVVPSVIASNSTTGGPSPIGNPGGRQGIQGPPGGPTSGDNGDPDDISILFNRPSNPTPVSGHAYTAAPPVNSRIAAYRAGALYLFFWWTGIGW